MTTPHKQAEFLRALADGRGDEFECQHESWAIDVWRDGFVYAGNIYDHPENWTVRRKTKTIELAGVKFLEPMRVAPAIGKMYWLASPTKLQSEKRSFRRLLAQGRHVPSQERRRRAAPQGADSC